MFPFSGNLPSAKVTPYIDDVFKAVQRSGTGASNTITTGFDLTTNPGFIWTKVRNTTGVYRSTDTVRGVTKGIVLNSTAAQTTDTNGITAFSSTGYTVGSDSGYNGSGNSYEDLVFLKGYKFLDVVSYVGNGSVKNISHSLGIAPGMIIVRRYDGVDSFCVWHRSYTSSAYYTMINNTNDQASDNTIWNSTNPTSSQFTVGTGLSINGGNYVAYVFAHDTSSTGIIQCGSFASDGSGNATVNLGWEIQGLILKRIGTAAPWYTFSTNRIMIAAPGTSTEYMSLNSSSGGASWSAVAQPIPIGFNFAGLAASATFTYTAIRRPNKVPTTGTQVYGAIARSGTAAAASLTGLGMTPDLVIAKPRTRTNIDIVVYDKLRGALQALYTTAAATDTSSSGSVTSFDMDGVTVGSDTSGNINGFNGDTYINWFLKRAPKFMEEVCYIGTGANTTVAHGLTVVPEMIWVKGRDNVGTGGTLDWRVYTNATGNTNYLVLNDVAASTSSSTVWNNTTPTASVFSVGTDVTVNGSSNDLVAYLFASVSGVSKIGTYTGNGSSLTIDCGFSSGARFVMIKRTDSTGAWFVFDTVRGIISGNDPYIQLNSTAAEVTNVDSLSVQSVGFGVSNSSTVLNNLGSTYIFLAIA